MIERLVVLGATGDLTARYLLPGLVALRAGGHIGHEFRLVAVGRSDWGDDEFWRVVTPVLNAWAHDLVPLEEYPAGSDGPVHLGEG